MKCGVQDVTDNRRRRGPAADLNTSIEQAGTGALSELVAPISPFPSLLPRASSLSPVAPAVLGKTGVKPPLISGVGESQGGGRGKGGMKKDGFRMGCWCWAGHARAGAAGKATPIVMPPLHATSKLRPATKAVSGCLVVGNGFGGGAFVQRVAKEAAAVAKKAKAKSLPGSGGAPKARATSPESDSDVVLVSSKSTTTLLSTAPARRAARSSASPRPSSKSPSKS